MPFLVIYSPTTTEADQWSFKATEGNIRIVMENNKNTYTSISSTHVFRYILIPGAVNARLSIDYSDYNSMLLAFKIPD
ncbi:hypothetical protein BH23BAC1_BH23BAC1_29640 [soil metagenome]